MITQTDLSDLREISRLQQIKIKEDEKYKLIGKKEICPSIPLVLCSDNQWRHKIAKDIFECISCGSKEFHRRDGYKKCIYCGSEY